MVKLIRCASLLLRAAAQVGSLGSAHLSLRWPVLCCAGLLGWAVCSRDGCEFIVARSVVLVSGTIRRLLQSPSSWAETSAGNSQLPTVRFESISARCLEQVAQYWYYKQRWDGATPPIPPFKLELAPQELTMAANFLDT